MANVIEADLHQLLGSYMQFLSLPTGSFRYYLAIVDRAAHVTPQLVDWARDLGMNCAAVEKHPQEHLAPYLNRWQFLPAFPELREAAHVAFIDWDIIQVSHEAFPQPVAGRILCRRNPLDMYRWLLRDIAHLVPAELLSEELDLSSSVNAGVVIACGSDMARFAERSAAWVARVFESLEKGNVTDKEQMAFSIALGEFGWNRLDDAWNVTPLSPVADADVHLWHYNNSVREMLQLKRRLLQPDFVRTTCQAFQSTWPRTMARFRDLYEQAWRQLPFRAFAATSQTG